MTEKNVPRAGFVQKKTLYNLAAVGLWMAFTGPVLANTVNPVVTGTANAALASDGIFPVEWAGWQDNTAWWEGLSTTLTFDYGAQYTISDYTVSLDNNDSYQIDYSTDNISWTGLSFIPSHVGENTTWGMDTFSSVAGNEEYVDAIDFHEAVVARYIRIYATGGDNLYSVGEFEAVTSLPEIPVPAAGWFLGSALLGLIGIKRRH